MRYARLIHYLTLHGMYAEAEQVRGSLTNSTKTKPWQMVRVPGRGPLSAEPPDGDDSFPPVIKSYEIVDGWLVYHGRDGSTGVIVGPKKALLQWMKDVDSYVHQAPSHQAVPWTRTHGGAPLVKEAIKEARKMLRGKPAQIRVWVHKGKGVHGEAVGNTINLVNVHQRETVTMLGVRVPAHRKTAAHEAAHLLYSRGGSNVLAALRKHRKVGVSTYRRIILSQETSKA